MSVVSVKQVVCNVGQRLSYPPVPPRLHFLLFRPAAPLDIIITDSYRNSNNKKFVNNNNKTQQQQTTTDRDLIRFLRLSLSVSICLCLAVFLYLSVADELRSALK